MSLRFEIETEKNEQPWKTRSSLDRKLLKKWEQQRRFAEQYYMQSRMKERINGNKLKSIINSHQLAITTVTRHCENAVSGMYKSVVFIFTTIEGIVLFVGGPSELIQRLDRQHNLGTGSLFAIMNAGVNAISLAIELEDWVFLSGAEHDFKLFEQWNCFCCPVRQHGEIIGYLDMSFSVNDDHLIMAALFASTLKSIEEDLGKCDQQTLVYKRLQDYGLAPREKEIAYMWLNNCGVLQIANELGITEGTVRNVIKKIYKKSQVCDKGQFMKKLFSW